MRDFVGILDGHKAHKDVRHSEVAEAPSERGNKRNNRNRLARRSVRKDVHQVRVHLVHRVNCRCKTVIQGADHRGNHQHGNEHQDSLYKIRPADRKEATKKRIAHDNDNADREGNRIIPTENRGKKLSAADKPRSRIEEEKRQDEKCGDDTDDSPSVAETVRKKIRKRDGIVAKIGVFAEPASDDFPVDIGPDGKPYANPRFGKPRKVNGPGKSHQKPAAHIGSLRRHRHDPLVHAAVSQVIGIQAIRLFRKIKSDAKHQQQVNDKYGDRRRHKIS